MSDTFLKIRGKLDWAKITGTARPYTGNPKYDKGPLWSLDITPDKESRALLAKHGLTTGGQSGTGKLRTPKGKDDRKETFISLKMHAKKADGSNNDPPKIVDVRGQPWDGSLIGNGTVADVKVKVKDYGAASEKGMYFQAARILDHVPYEAVEFDAIDEDDEYFAKAETGSAGFDGAPDTSVFDADLDDDVPF